MKHDNTAEYLENVEEYLSEELLGEVEIRNGDEFPWLLQSPENCEECTVRTILQSGDKFILTIDSKADEGRSSFTNEFIVANGSRLELNAADLPIMCFLPLEMIPVLVEVLDVAEGYIRMKTVAVRADYAASIA